MKNKIEDDLAIVLEKIAHLNRNRYKDKPYIKVSKEDIATIMFGILYYKLNDTEDDDDDDYDD